MTASDSSFEYVVSKGQITTVRLEYTRKIITVAEKKAPEMEQEQGFAEAEPLPFKRAE